MNLLNNPINAPEVDRIIGAKKVFENPGLYNDRIFI